MNEMSRVHALAEAESGEQDRCAGPASAPIIRIRARLGARSIVLVGLMGAGKSTVGRRLAHKLGLPFRDADHEIEAAAGMTIPDIFAIHGEAYFRDGERRVIARLLQEGPMVLATGGGAFMSEETRARIARARHLDLAQGRSRRADAPRAQARQPPAAAERRPGGHDAQADGGPPPGLRAGRPDGRVARGAARPRRERDRRGPDGLARPRRPRSRR